MDDDDFTRIEKALGVGLPDWIWAMRC